MLTIVGRHIGIFIDGNAVDKFNFGVNTVLRKITCFFLLLFAVPNIYVDACRAYLRALGSVVCCSVFLMRLIYPTSKKEKKIPAKFKRKTNCDISFMGCSALSHVLKS